jgi:hypothetical protein
MRIVGNVPMRCGCDGGFIAKKLGVFLGAF